MNLRRRPEKFLIIIGAPKSGTTSVADFLNADPRFQLCSNKEPRFFTDFHRTDWSGPGSDDFKRTLISSEDAYLSAFDAPGEALWAIDASTDYLWCEAAPERILEWSRRFDTRLICILRDPVDRVVSEYQHTLRDLLQDEPLRRSLELEDERFQARRHPLFYHVRRSRYQAPLRRYRDLFGERLLVLDFKEVGTAALADRVGRFLSVDLESGRRKPSRSNASTAYRSAALAGLLRSRGVRGLARRIIPEGARPALRRMHARLNERPYRVTLQDEDALRRRLGEEIRRCVADPSMPTHGWSRARALVGEA